jgi:hypothetical protein
MLRWLNWIGAALCGTGLVLSALPVGGAADELPAGHKRHTVRGTAFRLNHFHVEQGREDSAKEYYKTILSPHLGFSSADQIESTKITDLLIYFGYSNVQPKDLHRLSSSDLMAKGASGDILATRFFAPKITDVHDQPVAVPEFGFGWRKLVRFRPTADSPAAAKGMLALYFLQNTVVAKATDDPYDADNAVSLFNQAIVARKKPVGGSFGDSLRSAYFLTYGPLVKVKEVQEGNTVRKVPDKASGDFENDGKLTFSLLATFDENDRNPETNSKAKEYFVPEACEQCHGGRIRGKVNFLDTDHWFDRVLPAYGLAEAKFSLEDFTAIAASPHGILYDGGKDTNTAQFKAAFDVIRGLNEGIKAQNADAGGSQFQLRAVTKWLDLHATDSQRVPPIKRGFGNQLWEENNDHKKIVYYLNRYCYRCHSSIAYNVFDRQAVIARKGTIERKVLEIERPFDWMPQDRIFPGLQHQDGIAQATGDLKEFLDLLNAVPE